MRRGSGRASGNLLLLLLALSLVQQIAAIEHNLPVTVSAVAVLLAVFFKPFVLLRDVLSSIHRCCLIPHAVVTRGDWSRLVWSPLLNADERHLYYNVASFVWKGVQLEREVGSAAFGALLLELAVTSQAITVAAAYALAEIAPEFSELPKYLCVTGCLSVVFGLNVVLQAYSPARTSFFDVSMPTTYVCWVELLLASYLNPRASFLANVCGIAAGWLHLHNTLQLPSRAWPGWWPPPPRQRFSSGGQLGTATASRTRPQAAPPSSPPQRHDVRRGQAKAAPAEAQPGAAAEAQPRRSTGASPGYSGEAPPVSPAHRREPGVAASEQAWARRGVDGAGSTESAGLSTQELRELRTRRFDRAQDTALRQRSRPWRAAAQAAPSQPRFRSGGRLGTAPTPQTQPPPQPQPPLQSQPQSQPQPQP